MNRFRRCAVPSDMTTQIISGAHHLQDELTLGERGVVDLVGLGLSNRQIAARLGISVRTVESHLGHVYTKTGIASRVRLAIEASTLQAA